MSAAWSWTRQNRRGILLTLGGSLLLAAVIFLGGPLLSLAMIYLGSNRWEEDRRYGDYNRAEGGITGKAFTWLPGDKDLILSFDRTLYRVNLAGTVLEPITPDRTRNRWTLAGSPNISADGTRLYYGLNRDWKDQSYHWSIVSSDLDGGNLVRYTHPEFGFAHTGPLLSPDGEHILFNKASFASSARPAVMKSDGSKQVFPDWPKGSYVLGGWSPDSKTFALYHRSADTTKPGSTSREGDIFISSIDNLALRRVARRASNPPAWSPDGKRLAYARIVKNPETIVIHTVRPDGSDLSLVAAMPWEFKAGTQNYGYGLRLAWSPDGSQLLVSGYSSHLGLIDVESGKIRLWTHPTVYMDVEGYATQKMYAEWTPDGSRILVLQEFRKVNHDDWLAGQEAFLFTLSPDLSSYRVLVRHSEDSVGEGALTKSYQYKPPVLGSGAPFPGGEPVYDDYDLALTLEEFNEKHQAAMMAIAVAEEAERGTATPPEKTPTASQEPGTPPSPEPEPAAQAQPAAEPAESSSRPGPDTRSGRWANPSVGIRLGAGGASSTHACTNEAECPTRMTLPQRDSRPSRTSGDGSAGQTRYTLGSPGMATGNCRACRKRFSGSSCNPA